MIFDSINRPEKIEGIVSARGEFKTRRKRAILATVALVASSASVIPFLAGQPLYAYWESIGKYLLILAMALVVVWGYLVRAAVNSYARLSGMENEY
jgi:hypothetical protein